MTVSLLVAYRALGVGELLTAVPALRALARAFPDHRHVLAAPGALAGLAALTDAVDEVADAAPLRPLPPAVHGADVAVNLHGRGSQSHATLLAARPRRMMAFGHAAVWPRAVAWRAGEHEVVRWSRLLCESGIPADPTDLRISAPRAPAPEVARGATLVHPVRRHRDRPHGDRARHAVGRAVRSDVARRVGTARCGPHVALWVGRSGDPHGSRTDPGLLDIPVAAVLAALDAAPDGLLERRDDTSGARNPALPRPRARGPLARQGCRSMKRWPPIVWPAMALASLLLLMGLGAGEDWALVSGVVLEVAVIVLAARLVLASRRGRPQPSWFPVLLGCLALFYLVSGLAAAVAGTRYLPAVLLAALIPTAAVLLMLATVRGKSAPADEDLASHRHDDPYPGIGADARAPVGDTPEHSDVQEGIPPR